MSTDRRWYEPPTPRDWRRPSTTKLRLQSSMSLRKAILDRTSSTPVSSTLDCTSPSTSSSSSGRSIIPEVDKSLLERNLQELLSNDPLDDPLKRDVRPPAGRNSRPASLRRNQSLANLNASYILRNWHGTDVFESVGTTPSRPRSSSMTKYAPLPSIASAKNPEYQPPPLIRSKTFDVIDTKMKNLPTVDDSQANYGRESEKENELEPRLLVIASIEGKTLPEYLSHARDGLLRSRPATRHGRLELFKSFGENYPVGVAWASEGTSLNPFQFPVTKHSKESFLFPSHSEADSDHCTLPDKQREDKEFHRRILRIPSQDYQVVGEMQDSREKKDMTDDNNDDCNCSDQENDDDDDDDDDDDGEDNEMDDDNDEDNDDEDDDDDEEEEDEGDNDDDDNDDDSDDDDDDDDSDDDDDDSGGGRNKDKIKEKNKEANSQAEQSSRGNEDIHIYFMLPDGSLLVVHTSSGWTLAALLGAVAGMGMGGRRLQVVLDGVQERDLSSGIQDLGITHNTTIYLLPAG
ncbi:protein IWS1 homolog [Scylla paramamosain]|uniref:protein IWS1 homolog n=1 Tax=Scylla paramamosain TaxID=85552 RepID=UPI003083C934